MVIPRDRLHRLAIIREPACSQTKPVYDLTPTGGDTLLMGLEPPAESWKLCTGSNRRGACRSTARTSHPYPILEVLRESIDLLAKNVIGLGILRLVELRSTRLG